MYDEPSSCRKLIIGVLLLSSNIINLDVWGKRRTRESCRSPRGSEKCATNTRPTHAPPDVSDSTRTVTIRADLHPVIKTQSKLTAMRRNSETGDTLYGFKSSRVYGLRALIPRAFLFTLSRCRKPYFHHQKRRRGGNLPQDEQPTFARWTIRSCYERKHRLPSRIPCRTET